jgi:penicillin-binding protein 1A
VKPTTIDYVEDREGKVIYRTDNRCAVMGNCNAPDWDGKGMPRPPNRTRQLVDPMAAFQMVHVMEGVIQRGTATVLRDLDRPMFGKTGTTNGPTNVWFVGGTPDIVAGVYLGYDQPRSLGGYAQGGRISAPIWKEWAKVALANQPKVPFVAPPGIRWVRIDRATGKRVFGVFPTTKEPKADVIWEAFQPQTEPRRSYRHGEASSESGEEKLDSSGNAVPKPRAPSRPRPAPAQPATVPAAQPAGLQPQNTIQ